MEERETAWRSPRRGAAVIACMAVVLASGCFDTVSLGEGETTGQGGEAPSPHVGP